jgi:hypothetical protein
MAPRADQPTGRERSSEPRQDEAAGARSLAEALAALDAQGYESQFQVVDDGDVSCLTCGRSVDRDGLDRDGVVRLPRDSAPDATARVRVHCSSCHARGVLVLRCGPGASAGEASVLDDLERARPR